MNANGLDADGIQEASVGAALLVYVFQYCIDIKLHFLSSNRHEFTVRTVLGYAVGIGLAFQLVSRYRHHILPQEETKLVRMEWIYLFGAIPAVASFSQSITLQIGHTGFQWALVEVVSLMAIYTAQSIFLRRRRWKLGIAIVMGTLCYLSYRRWAPDWEFLNGLEFSLFGLTAIISGLISLASQVRSKARIPMS